MQNQMQRQVPGGPARESGSKLPMSPTTASGATAEAAPEATAAERARRREDRAQVLRRRAELLARPLGSPSPAARRALLTFRRSECFAVPAEAVVEVRPCPLVEAVPGLPRIVAGVAAVRGRVVAVIDLAPDRPSAGGGEGPEIVVVAAGDLEAALLADSVGRVVEVETDRLEPLRAPTPSWLGAVGFDPGVGTLVDPFGLLGGIAALLGSASSTGRAPVQGPDGTRARQGGSTPTPRAGGSGWPGTIG